MVLDEDLAIANLTGCGAASDGVDHRFNAVVINDNVKFEFLPEFNGEFDPDKRSTCPSCLPNRRTSLTVFPTMRAFDKATLNIPQA